MRVNLFFLLASIGLTPTLMLAQSGDDPLTFDGDMLVRGFYISRDLPLERVTKEPCPNPFDKGVAGKTQSRCQ